MRDKYPSGASPSLNPCYNELMEISRDARAIFNSMREGIVLIDTRGMIIFANKQYTQFVNKERGADVGADIEGRRLLDLRPGALLPGILESGDPIMHAPRKEDKDIYFVNMYPVVIGGCLAGGLSVVTFVEDAKDFKAELEDYEKRTLQMLRRINKANGARYTFDSIIASSPVSLETKALALKIAATDATVLLQSESGTGKELYAQAIHNASHRSRNVFVAVNCANFSADMLESELFGYEEGAFTGAKKGGKIGLFEAANHGTVFLDEISEMPLELQSKLLRVLQERRLRKIGSVAETDVDVRVIAACNANLTQYIAEGKFRKDLFYRLNVFPVRIPPLRERPEDIGTIAAALIDELSRKRKRRIRITDDAMRALESHSWPGNVRELQNVLEFSSCIADDCVIDLSVLPGHLVRGSEESRTLAERVRAFERGEITRLLQRHGNSLRGKQTTAAALGISLATLYNKLGEG